LDYNFIIRLTFLSSIAAEGRKECYFSISPKGLGGVKTQIEKYPSVKVSAAIDGKVNPAFTFSSPWAVRVFFLPSDFTSRLDPEEED